MAGVTGCGRRRIRCVGVCVLVLAAVAGGAAACAPPGAPPAGFQEVTAFAGLTNPTVVRFSPDGRVFVAEKSGLIKVFDDLSDTTATVFADLRTNVHNYWDRGLLGMALHPDFPTSPYVYVLYTYDAPIGGSAPTWGAPGATSDGCPTPPGPNDDGCVVSGRLSRLEASGSVMTGSERVLINDWCQQYPSHSVGTLEFGADGMLYASGGDGASFDVVDYGQDGAPPNPCGDPPGGRGATLAPPSAEGGALRAQDVRTGGDPVSLSGTVIRVDPETGAGVAGNPLFASSDPNARRIVAHGLRNPFRLARRPGTGELWVGDVGWNEWEEIDRLVAPADGVMDNFGWPCYEGGATQPGYDNANLSLCEGLYAAGPGAVITPRFAYRHADHVTGGENCPVGGSSITGLAFYQGDAYPDEYRGSLFFADYTRNCIWVMMRGEDGLPNPADVRTFRVPAAGPVNLEIGPTGELFYPALNEGSIKRIVYTGSSTVVCDRGQFKSEYFAGMALGDAPVFARCESAVDHDWGTGGPGGGVPADQFSARWTGTQSFPTAGAYAFTVTADDGVRLWVDDRLLVDAWVDQPLVTHTATVSLAKGDHAIRVEFFENTLAAVIRLSWRPVVPQAPTATIDTPTAATTWRVGEVVPFSGHATDPQQGPLPASALTWSLVMQHCPSTCHAHPIQTYAGVAGGSFTAPDHEYPSYLELVLTATDVDGNTSTTRARLDPRTVALRFDTVPPGLAVTVGGASAPTPFERPVIVGSANSVTANSPQTVGTTTYRFSRWSDGGAATHVVTAPATATTYTATYAVPPL